MPLQRKQKIALFLLCLVTFLIYFQIYYHEFTAFDDPGYITNNQLVKKGISINGILWSFVSTQQSNWHPLTWISLMCDVQLFGMHPGAHHLMNLAFHIANTLLVFSVLHLITKNFWKCFFVAALFALHPMHVESVAWACERKDVLSTLFWLLTTRYYILYTQNNNPLLRQHSLTCFILGLLAKPMLVTLPFTLILLDYWPLNRLQNHKLRLPALVKEKIPFILLSFVFSVIAIGIQPGARSTMAPLSKLGILDRISNTLFAYGQYIYKMLIPKDMCIFYPLTAGYKNLELESWKVVVSGFVITFISYIIWQTKERFPYLLMGWLWFLGTLIPVIGLVQVGMQSMADRYSYISYMGLFVMLVWGLWDMMKHCNLKKMAHIVISVYLLILIPITWVQIGYWKDSVTVIEHAYDVTEDNYRLQESLAFAYHHQKQYHTAISHFERALAFRPKSIDVLNKISETHIIVAEYDKAIYYLTGALRFTQQSPELKKHYEKRLLINLLEAFERSNKHKEADEIQKQISLIESK